MLGGQSLEKEVERIYRLLGAELTERNKLIEHYEIDVFAVFKNGPIEYRVIVECKQYGPDKMVADDDMTTFIAKLLLAKSKRMAEIGVLVTTSGFTKNARKSAEDNKITCLTLDQLYNQLVEFKFYLTEVKAKFQNSDLAKYYIEQTGSTIEDYATLLRSEFEAVSCKPLVDHLVKFFYDHNEKRMAILGNLGTGKTSLCQVLLNRLIDEYLADPTKRVPILISLKEFRSGLDIDELVTAHLQKLPGVRVNIQLCKELQKMGRFIFIFDGLDEMASKVDRIVINENLRELDRLYREGDNYYIITCRTHFFQEKISDEFLPDYKVFYLTEWTMAELEEYLQRRFPDNKDKLLKKIRSHPAIRELARTPIFLDMILDNISSIPDDVSLGVPKLYKTYTDEWIEKQSKRRGAVMTSRQRIHFVTELSSLIYMSDHLKIHFTALYNVSKDISGYIDNTRVDYFDTDARTATFITKDSNDNYGFYHSSFMEFFCAQKMMAEVNEGITMLLSHKSLSPELLMFVPLENAAPVGIENLRNWSRQFKEQYLSANAVTILQRLNIRLDKEVEDHFQINRSEWEGLRRGLYSDNVDDLNLFITDNYKMLSEMVISISMRYLNEPLTKEIIQNPAEIISELFIKLWNIRKEVENGITPDTLSLRVFLARVLSNIIKEKVDKERKSPIRYENEFAGTFAKYTKSEDPFDSEGANMDELTRQLYEAIDQLSPSSKLMFQLRYFERRSLKEISEIMGMHESSSANALYRIMTQLKNLINRNTL